MDVPPSTLKFSHIFQFMFWVVCAQQSSSVTLHGRGSSWFICYNESLWTPSCYEHDIQQTVGVLFFCFDFDIWRCAVVSGFRTSAPDPLRHVRFEVWIGLAKFVQHIQPMLDWIVINILNLSWWEATAIREIQNKHQLFQPFVAVLWVWTMSLWSQRPCLGSLVVFPWTSFAQ